MNILREKQKARGHHFLCSSDAPDNSGINAAALAQAELSKEQLAFIKDVYAQGAPDRADAAAAGKRASAQQETATGQQIALTDKYGVQQDKQFGFEDSLRTEAQDYDSSARQEANAGRATAGVQAALDSSQDQAQRNLARMGVNPSSGRTLAMSGQLGIQKAGLLAGAANKARTDTESQGYARKMDSASLGRNLAGNQATSAQTAMSLGNSSVANALVPVSVAQTGAGLMNSGFSGASSSMNSAGSLYGTAGKISADAAAAGSAGAAGLGSAVGGIAMAI